MTIREQVIAQFIERFGEAELGPDPAGLLYRWRLARKNKLDVHVIIDSPDIETRAHVLVSDPCPDMPPIRSTFVSDLGEVKEVLDQIESQWQMRGCWSPDSPTPARDAERLNFREEQPLGPGHAAVREDHERRAPVAEARMGQSSEVWSSRISE